MKWGKDAINLEDGDGRLRTIGLPNSTKDPHNFFICVDELFGITFQSKTKGQIFQCYKRCMAKREHSAWIAHRVCPNKSFQAMMEVLTRPIYAIKRCKDRIDEKKNPALKFRWEVARDTFQNEPDEFYRRERYDIPDGDGEDLCQAITKPQCEHTRKAEFGQVTEQGGKAEVFQAEISSKYRQVLRGTYDPSMDPGGHGWVPLALVPVPASGVPLPPIASVEAPPFVKMKSLLTKTKRPTTRSEMVGQAIKAARTSVPGSGRVRVDGDDDDEGDGGDDYNDGEGEIYGGDGDDGGEDGDNDDGDGENGDDDDDDKPPATAIKIARRSAPGSGRVIVDDENEEDCENEAGNDNA